MVWNYSVGLLIATRSYRSSFSRPTPAMRRSAERGGRELSIFSASPSPRRLYSAPFVQSSRCQPVGEETAMTTNFSGTIDRSALELGVNGWEITEEHVPLRAATA